VRRRNQVAAATASQTKDYPFHPRNPRLRFRRKIGHDLLEARIAAEGIPKRQQFQLAIIQCPAQPERRSNLVTREIFLT
jgi:hypothetical protein